MKFVLPLPPNMANARWHWRTRQAYKEEYMFRLDLILNSCRVESGKRKPSTLYDFTVPLVPASPLVRARIEATITLHNYMDDDNAMARLKFPLDWMTTRGYIQDDSRRTLQWLRMPDQILSRKDSEKKVEITLTDLLTTSDPTT